MTKLCAVESSLAVAPYERWMNASAALFLSMQWMI
jgi:hypothetical protein